MPKFTALLLDPAAATIHPVEILTANALETFYRLIGCNLVDRVWLDDTHLAYVDDEGLTECITGLWSQKDSDMSPVAGRAVIVADDGEGGDTTLTVPIEKWAKRFRIFRPVIVPDLVTLTPVAPGDLGGAIVSATRIGGLRLALDRPVLNVTREEASQGRSPKGNPKPVPLDPFPTLGTLRYDVFFYPSVRRLHS